MLLHDIILFTCLFVGLGSCILCPHDQLFSRITGKHMHSILNMCMYITGVPYIRICMCMNIQLSYMDIHVCMRDKCLMSWCLHLCTYMSIFVGTNQTTDWRNTLLVQQSGGTMESTQVHEHVCLIKRLRITSQWCT